MGAVANRRLSDPHWQPMHRLAITLSFVIPTRISCHAALDGATCAPFREERRMKWINAINLHRKSGGAQPRDLRFSGPFLGMFSFEPPSSSENLNRIRPPRMKRKLQLIAR
jgi:hypothetical protein